MRATALPGTANSRRSSGITASAVGAKGWPSRRFTVSTLVDWADDVEVRKQGTNSRAIHETHNRCADILMLPIRGTYAFCSTRCTVSTIVIGLLRCGAARFVCSPCRLTEV